MITTTDIILIALIFAGLVYLGVTLLLLRSKRKAQKRAKRAAAKLAYTKARKPYKDMWDKALKHENGEQKNDK